MKLGVTFSALTPINRRRAARGLVHERGGTRRHRGRGPKSDRGEEVAAVGRYNVNAARAQRLEALGERWEFEVDGELFGLADRAAPRRRAEAGRRWTRPIWTDCSRLLLGEEQFKRLDEHAMSVQDIQALLEAYGRDTGMTLGESSASTRS